MSAHSIINSMDDPALFAPWYRGPSWDGWRSVLKAMHCLPMSDAEVVFFNSVAERYPPKHPVREAWIAVGRGGGKDSIASVIVGHTAATFEPYAGLRPGERPLCLLLACDREQAKICLGYVRSYFTDIPLLREMVTRETANGFELSNGVDIAIATNSFRAVRGRSILCCVLDECAFYRSDKSANPDEELYRALRPALARVPGSTLIGISSPYRKAGLLWRKFAKHYGKNDDVLVIRAASKTLNPTLDQAEIDRDLADDPASARAEWFAEWRDDIAGWMDLETIEAAVDSGVTVRPPSGNQRVHYHAGLDPSGGAKDSFTAAIAHNENGVAVLDCLVEIKSPFNPTGATETIAETLKAYNVRVATGDKYAAGWVVDAFAKCGIRYQHSERDRSQIYLDAMPLFTSGRARLLDNQRLVTQFAQLERRTSSMGRDKVDHGKGGHDDLCNAAALAMVLTASKRSSLFISESLVRRTAQPRIGERAAAQSGRPASGRWPPCFPTLN